MQGNLDEIDISSILQLIEFGQRTGLLFVEAYNSHSSKKLSICAAPSQQAWFVFFLNGQIIYATHGDRSLSRVGDYLRHYKVNVRFEEIPITELRMFDDVPEYSYLWALLAQNLINPTQARCIIHNLIDEVLFDLMRLQQGRFIFQINSALTPQLTTLEMTPLVAKITKQVQEWKQFYPFIQSPEQFPLLTDIAQLQSSLPPVTVNKLKHWADGKTSLRQLARYLNRDIVTVAKAMYPYVQQHLVKFVYSITTQNPIQTQYSKPELEGNQRARILCIDDTTTICETIDSILNAQGYKVISLTDPLQALSSVFQIEPDLILCNITMPDLDGYEICAMLRQSTAFRLVPIILLAEEGGYIERTRAKMVGATDYLTKPFANTELLLLVERYVNYSVVWGDNRDKTVVDPTKDEVKNNITESASFQKTLNI